MAAHQPRTGAAHPPVAVGVPSSRQAPRGGRRDCQVHRAAQPKAVGQHGTSFTIVNLETLTDTALAAFEQAVRDEPRVLDCYYVAGSNDYLIRFTYRDAEDLERFHTEVLMRLPGVMRSNSMLVLRTVKKTTALAL